MDNLIFIAFALSFGFLVSCGALSIARQYKIQSSPSFRQKNFYKLSPEEIKSIVKSKSKCSFRSGRPGVFSSNKLNATVQINDKNISITCDDGKRLRASFNDVITIKSNNYSQITLKLKDDEKNNQWVVSFGEPGPQHTFLFYKFRVHEPVRGDGYKSDITSVAYYMYISNYVS